jgi:multiple sugar transport system permease protein
VSTQLETRHEVPTGPRPATRRNASGSRIQAKPIGAGVLTLAATFLFLLPIVWIFTTSLKPTGEIFAIPPTVLPQDPTVQHFGDVLTGTDVLQLFGNSLIVATGATLVSLLLGIPAAYGFARFRFRLSGALLGGALVTRFFPPVVLALPFFLQFRSMGLINNTLGLVIAYIPVVLPLVIWMLEGFFRKLPEELAEAARLDGLGTLGILTRIVLPISRPAVGVAALFGFLAAWNEFVIALALTRTPDAQTMPVGIAGYITQFQTYWGQMTAASVVYLLPVLVVTVVAQRGIIAGLMSGASKG